MDGERRRAIQKPELVLGRLVLPLGVGQANVGEEKWQTASSGRPEPKLDRPAGSIGTLSAQ
jgi:hypothetical protein